MVNYVDIISCNSLIGNCVPACMYARNKGSAERKGEKSDVKGYRMRQGGRKGRKEGVIYAHDSI